MKKILGITCFVMITGLSVFAQDNSTPPPTPPPAPAPASDTTAPVAAVQEETKETGRANSTFGLRALYGAAALTTEGLGNGVETETSDAWSVGFFWTYSTGGTIAFAIQPELMYVSESAVLKIGTLSSQTITSESIRLPILLKMELFNRAIIQPSIYAGPSFSYILNGTSTTGNTTSDLKGLNTFQVGLAAGIDVTFLNFILIDLRYNLGLTTLAEETVEGATASMKMSSFRIGLGLRF